MKKLNDEELSKLINSDDAEAKKKLIYQPSTSSEILYKFLEDKRIDVIQAILSHKNIDKNIFDKVIDTSYTPLPDYVYKIFLQNPKFNKEWFVAYIKFLKDIKGGFEIIGYILREQQFFENDNDWIKTYNVIKDVYGNFKEKQWSHYWYEFLYYPLRTYSETILLHILNENGKEIVTIGTSFKLHPAMNTPLINAKMFELTNKMEFLSKEAQDIFVF